MYVFRNEKDPDTPIEPVGYCKEFLKQEPESVVYVGTDSQAVRRRKGVTYATAICFKVGMRGVHVIYRKERIPKPKTLVDRLWKEIEMSLEVADHLSHFNVRIDQIDLDYNDEPGWASNQLSQAGIGYAMYRGYNAGVKPEVLVASRAADHIARKG